MSSGFSISKIIGMRCSAMSRCSRVWEGSTAMIKVDTGPRCVIRYM